MPGARLGRHAHSTHTHIHRQTGEKEYVQETLSNVKIQIHDFLKLRSIYLWFFSFSVKPRKGSVGHKHRLEASPHGKCRLCSALESTPVCGSDGHTYSSKVRCLFPIYLPLSFIFFTYADYRPCVILNINVTLLQVLVSAGTGSAIRRLSSS